MIRANAQTYRIDVLKAGRAALAEHEKQKEAKR